MVLYALAMKIPRTVQIAFNKVSNFSRGHPHIFLFILAIGIRLILLAFLPLPDQSGSDFPFYSEAAQSILAGEGVGNIRHIAPGQSAWLSVIYFFSSSSYAVVSGQVLLSGLLSIGVYSLTRRVFDERIGLYAGFILAVWPAFLIQTFNYGKSVLLYTTLLTFGILYFVRAVQESRIWYAFMSGILLSTAALTDVIGLFLAVVLIGWVALLTIFSRTTGSIQHVRWKNVIVGVVFLVSITAPLLGWGYRNLLIAEGGDAPIVAKQVEKRLVHKEDRALFTKRVQHYAPSVISQSVWRTFVVPFDLSIFSADPTFSYKNAFRNIVFYQSTDLTSRQIKIMIVKIIITVMHLALLFAAAWGLWRFRRKPLSWLTVLLLGYVYAAVVGFVAFHRGDFGVVSPLSGFLVPLLPFLTMFAAAIKYEK